ncbi:EpsG family protein [Vagococcus lutrae]|uniref:EpsG family protein n=1 Tax=Vagococcus lutrae TaxID=81947 RepID=UPI00200BE068|nr:EpsG family protein [Vagococcus lutrae]UQF37571.1 EpsG family protein [Vagococcus lutrae]
MVIVLYLSILFFNLLIGVRKKNAKVVLIFSIFLLSLLVSSNQASLDNINYLFHYNNLKYGVVTSNESEFGFIYLMNLGNILGLSWAQFKFICYLFGYTLFFRAISNILPQSNKHLIIVIYLTYLYFIDAEQVRNFISLSVFMFGLSMLMTSFNKKNIFIYLITLLVSISIHNSMIFYSFFPLFFKKSHDKKRIVYLTMTFSIILSLVTYFNGNQIPFVKELLSIISDDNAKIERYLEKKTSLGFLLPTSYAILNIIVLNLITKYINSTNEKKEIHIKNINIIYELSLISLVFIPLTMQSVTFYRLYRNLLPLVYASFAYSVFICKGWKRTILVIVFFLTVLYWFIFDIGIKVNEIYLPFFFDNLFT